MPEDTVTRSECFDIRNQYTKRLEIIEKDHKDLFRQHKENEMDLTVAIEAVKVEQAEMVARLDRHGENQRIIFAEIKNSNSKYDKVLYGVNGTEKKGLVQLVNDHTDFIKCIEKMKGKTWDRFWTSVFRVMLGIVMFFVMKMLVVISERLAHVTP